MGHPVPFSPEVYREVGKAVFENGVLVELTLDKKE
jgi:hypothetical protein